MARHLDETELLTLLGVCNIRLADSPTVAALCGARSDLCGDL